MNISGSCHLIIVRFYDSNTNEEQNVNLGELFKLQEGQFPHLQNKDEKAHITDLLGRHRQQDRPKPNIS